MADQGEGGIDASDDMDARMASERQRNRELESEAIKLERKALEARLERARIKAQGPTGFTLSGGSFATGSNTTVGAYMGGMGGNFDVGSPTWSGAPGASSGGTVGFPSTGQIPRSNKYANAKDAEWSTFSSGASQSGDGEGLVSTFKSLSFAGIGLIAAFGTVASVAKAISESQKSGAKEIGDVRGSLGSSLADMGIKGPAADKMIQEWESESAGPLDDPMKRAQFMSAGAASKRKNNPTKTANVNGLNDVYKLFANKKITYQQMMDTAENGLSSFDAMTTLNSIRPGGSEELGAYGSDSASQDAGRSRLKFKSEGENYRIGQSKLNNENFYENMTRDGGARGAAGWLANTAIGQFFINNLSESMYGGGSKDPLKVLNKIEQNGRQKPPSTNE